MIIKTLKAIAAFIVAIAVALLLSIVDFELPEERNYFGITEQCIPDIAYDATYPWTIPTPHKSPNFRLLKKGTI